MGVVSIQTSSNLLCILHVESESKQRDEKQLITEACLPNTEGQV